MTIEIPDPLYFEDCELKIGADDYGAACSAVTLTPSPNVQTFSGLKPGADYHKGRVTWVLDMTYAQDWTNATSLARKLWTAQGTVITDCTFKPTTDDTPEFTVDLYIVPGSVGGAGRAHATSTVQLPVQGQPAFADA